MLLLLPTTSLHMMFAVPADLLMETPVFIGPFDKSVPESEKFKMRYWQCRHLRSLMNDLRLQMTGELFFVIAWWLLLFSQHGLIRALLILMLMTVTSSFYFITFTQPAHLNESAMKNMEENVFRKSAVGGAENLTPDRVAGFSEEEIHRRDPWISRIEGNVSNEKCNTKLSIAELRSSKTSDETLMGRWVREQIAYTVDIKTHCWWTYLVSGGLGMQSIHHCLPIVSHTHYVDMYPGFQKVLAKHGVYTKVVPSWSHALLDFFKWIQLLQHEAPEELDWAKKHV